MDAQLKNKMKRMINKYIDSAMNNEEYLNEIFEVVVERFAYTSGEYLNSASEVEEIYQLCQEKLKCT